MKLCSLAFTVLTLFAVSAIADVTPMDQDIPELAYTTITCKVAAALRAPEDRKEDSQEYHYVVYLPAGYKANDKREYPVLWVHPPIVANIPSCGPL